MCLDTRFKPEVEKKMIAKLPDGLITVYKAAFIKSNHIASWLCGRRYNTGKNKAIDLSDRNDPPWYGVGFHSFVTLYGIKKYLTALDTLHHIKFQIRKEWITAIGKQGGCIVYVTDRIISPSPSDKSAIVE